MGEMRRESEKDGGNTYIKFSKNRNGNVNIKLNYSLENNSIQYLTLENDDVEQLISHWLAQLVSYIHVLIKIKK